jgi:hypothetical protein
VTTGTVQKRLRFSDNPTIGFGVYVGNDNLFYYRYPENMADLSVTYFTGWRDGYVRLSVIPGYDLRIV